MLWHLVEHRDRGALMDRFMFCPECWQTHEVKPDRVIVVGSGTYATRVKAVPFAEGERCHVCDKDADV